MRYALLLGAAIWAGPVAAQDHSAHQSSAQSEHTQPTPTPAPMDHCAMGHLPPEQCPPKTGAEPAANDGGQMDHSQHGAQPDKSAPGAAPENAVPARALEGPDHAADAFWGEAAMSAAREEVRSMHGAMKTGTFMLERLEARIPTEGGDAGWLWDAQGFYGGDIDTFVVKSEGEAEIGGPVEDAEIQALWGHAIGPFFDLEAGVRVDVEPETRSHLVLGVQGLTPYMWEVDLAAFLSDRGDLTARLEAEYDQRITQRLILQPRIELELSAQDIPERAIGAGPTRIEPGLRLRYHFTPEFAPYIGVEYEAKLGDTADIARAAGEDAAGLKVLLGIRTWF